MRGKAYDNVKSKVGRNMKVIKSVNKQKKTRPGEVAKPLRPQSSMTVMDRVRNTRSPVKRSQLADHRVYYAQPVDINTV